MSADEEKRRSTDYILGALESKLDAIEKNFETKFFDSDRMVQNQFQHMDLIMQNLADAQKEMMNQIRIMFAEHINRNDETEKVVIERIEKIEVRVLKLEEAPGQKAIGDVKNTRKLVLGGIGTVVTAVAGAVIAAKITGGP